MKNKRIKMAMFQTNIDQKALAEILGVTSPEMSIMLKYELAVKEQNEIVKRIREWDALRQQKKEA